MTNKKQNLREDLTQIDYLMGYDRSKTIFEQKNKKFKILKETGKQQLNEGFPWLAAGVIAGAGSLIGWLRGDTMSDSEKVNIALDPEAWPSLEKTLKDISYSAGYDITDKMTLKSASEAKSAANKLFDAMDGKGTNESKIRSAINSCKSVLDMARVTYEFGEREDWTLRMWFTKPYYGVKELSSSEFTNTVEEPIENNPFAIFDDKNYEDGESFLEAVGAYVEGQEECEEGFEKDDDGKCVAVEPEEVNAFNESFACVVETSKKHGGKLKKSKGGLEYYQIRIGNDVGLFTVDGRVVFYPGGKKANRKPATGFASYVCQGDELSLGDEGDVLSLDEGLKRALKKKSNLSEEEINFGGMYFEVGGPDTPPEEVKPPSGGGGGTDNRQRYTKGPSFEQVVSGSRTMHRGHSGSGVKKLQELLPGATLKLDGVFGPATESAVIAFQKANDTGQESGGEVMSMTAKALLRGGQGGSQEQVTTVQGCTAAQKANGMLPVPGGGCSCPNGQKADANGKCVTDQEYPEHESVAVVVNTSDNKGDMLQAGDQLVFDSEGGVDVLVSPSGTRFETSDDIEVTKYNKSGEFKKIVTATQKCTFYKDGKIKKCRDRRKGLFGLGGSKNK